MNSQSTHCAFATVVVQENDFLFCWVNWKIFIWLCMQGEFEVILCNAKNWALLPASQVIRKKKTRNPTKQTPPKNNNKLNVPGYIQFRDSFLQKYSTTCQGGCQVCWDKDLSLLVFDAVSACIKCLNTHSLKQRMTLVLCVKRFTPDGGMWWKRKPTD